MYRFKDQVAFSSDNFWPETGRYPWTGRRIWGRSNDALSNDARSKENRSNGSYPLVVLVKPDILFLGVSGPNQECDDQIKEADSSRS